MPRDGSGNYTLPYPAVVDGTTIESAVHNGTMSDIALQLNGPVPIIAGGTGANNALDARNNMNAEVRGAQVTNYDTHVFEAGSFWSTAAATTGLGMALSGIAHFYDANNLTLEAWHYEASATGDKYVRQKQGGVWLPWQVVGGTQADLDARYVNLTGDTMTGDLLLSGSAFLKAGTGTPAVTYQLNASAATFSNISVLATTGPVEGLYSADTTGVVLGSYTSHPLTFRTGNAPRMVIAPSGDITMNHALIVSGTISSGVKGSRFGVAGGTGYTGTLTSADANVLFYNNATNNWAGMGVDTGGNFWLRTGTSGAAAANTAMRVEADTRQVTFPSFLFMGGNAQVTDGANTTSGVIYFGSANAYAKYLQFDGPTNTLTFTSGYFRAGQGYSCRSGFSGTYTGSAFNIQYTGNCVMWIDSTNVGNITLTSDYRTKKDVIDLPGMWETVKGLRPIKYTQADFTPPAQLAANDEAKAEGRTVEDGYMFKADNIERWGFIAHELQETLVESASTGVKDSPDHVQSPNMATIVAALTKALQEAMARIEALEAA